jgi:predicted Fe-S protein YdhL (DUF1289 family)
MIASPCINVCRMDEASGLCEGCYRSIKEIAVWAAADDQEKSLILAAVAQRRQNLEIATGTICNCADS